MTESLIDKISGVVKRWRPPVTSDVEIKATEITEKPNPSTIIGEIVKGKLDPKTISKEQFSQSSEILYHGAAFEFSYSPTGDYDRGRNLQGTNDFGAGFYATDNRSQAENYSTVRDSENRDKPIVSEYLPFNAKVLDVRDKNNPNNNGVLQPEFILDWLKFLEDYVSNESNFSKYSPANKKIVVSGIKEIFINRLKKHINEGKNILIREDRYGNTGIFGDDRNGLIDWPFRLFMLSKGYDGMIYREPGEGAKRTDINGFVFYNYQAIDTWEGWQKRTV